MNKCIFMFGAAMAVSACGQQGGNSTANAPVNAAAAPAQAPRRAYCFFKERETKDWKARLDKAGNVVVTGKVYREDSRYKAVLGPSTMNGTTAEIAPTLTVNDTGYAAPGDWWNVIATIPDSQAIDTVAVNCGEKTIATLKIPRKK